MQSFIYSNYLSNIAITETICVHFSHFAISMLRGHLYIYRNNMQKTGEGIQDYTIVTFNVS